MLLQTCLRPGAAGIARPRPSSGETYDPTAESLLAWDLQFDFLLDFDS